MASIDFNGFVVALAGWMAGRASPALTLASGLWVFRAVEAGAADPYSVLVPYGGAALPWVPVPVVSVQCKTIGTSRDGASKQSQSLFGALLDADGRPARRAAVSAGWRLVGVDLRSPAEVGVDDRDRVTWAFNFDAKFVALA